MTAYCNKDIIELTYECSLEVLEFFSAEEKNIQRDVEKWLMNILVIGNGFECNYEKYLLKNMNV